MFFRLFFLIATYFGYGWFKIRVWWCALITGFICFGLLQTIDFFPEFAYLIFSALEKKRAFSRFNTGDYQQNYSRYKQRCKDSINLSIGHCLSGDRCDYEKPNAPVQPPAQEMLD